MYNIGYQKIYGDISHIYHHVRVMYDLECQKTYSDISHISHTTHLESRGPKAYWMHLQPSNYSPSRARVVLTPVYVCIYIYVYIDMYTDMYAYLNIFIRVGVQTTLNHPCELHQHLCILVYIYIYIYIYIYVKYV